MYSFCSLDKRTVVMSTVPVRRALPKGVKLPGSIIFLSKAIVKGVPSGYDRCALILEVSTF